MADNSYDIYLEYIDHVNQTGDIPNQRTVFQFANMITEELKRTKHSPLLDSAVSAWLGNRKHDPAAVLNLNTIDVRIVPPERRLPSLTAFILILYTVEQLDPGFLNRQGFRMPDKLFTMFGSNKAYEWDWRKVKEYIYDIDAKMTEFFRPVQNSRSKCEDKKYSSLSFEDQSTDRIKADQIIENARKEAAQIIQNAENQTRRMIENAEKECAERIAAAEQRMNQLRRQDPFNSSRNDIIHSLDEIRRTLNTTGTSLNEIEKTVHDTMANKLFQQYYQLYQLISDLKNSAGIDSKIRNNYEMFLDMIEENLQEFGIETIASKPGTPFNGKIHRVVNSQSFDPKNVKIRRSIMHGFMIGDQVLQKEKTEI